jgi:hypothetical protein
MMSAPRLRLALILFASASLGLFGCSDDTTGVPEGPQGGAFVRHLDRGCSRVEAPENDPGSSFLRDFSFDGSTLILTIHFVANCCPVFAESCTVESGNIEIDLWEVESQCDCICPFDNDFIFIYKEAGDLRVHFRLLHPPNGFVVSEFDTVITLAAPVR